MAASLALGLAACGGNDDHHDNNSSQVTTFNETLLDSDGSVANTKPDPDLQNGWGVTFNPTATMWVSDNNAHKSSLFDGNGNVQSLVVSIPDGAAGPAGPTGIIFNPTTDFSITSNGATSNAVFIWATDAGTIAAWSPKVLPTEAVTAFDDAVNNGGANYKGITMVTIGGENRLYATDFHNAKVDTFDAQFNKIAPAANQFVDPNMPAGFAPFGIQHIGNSVFVTYAQQNAAKNAQVVGDGLGVLDEFDLSGNFVRRIVSNGGVLNAPWGIVLAPANFGPQSGMLLVGNFGSGFIEVFNPTTGQDMGKLMLGNGQPFQQSGLWGMSFGNNVDNQPSNTIFFAAGPSKTTGVFGRIDPVTTTH
ncbi:TIGR03118 family protein [Paraburkholderia rhizosphaerae]|uniref:TIGR03118 family protein n=1 Tax=Paraburkholderia rhizosphaerae TaxID=480658 RepID=UPI001FBB1BEF|nr:TIGR03118 family protein [Paraburkholderia rhizosphaerae]